MRWVGSIETESIMGKQQFEATEGLLNDVMKKQSGSIEKAILEGVMNSVDAGASEISVRINPDEVVISDDGKGMTEGEIETYFRLFGFKDDDIEEKTFGHFRMGRGQIFSFGLNEWHTKNNILVVDLDNDETSVEVDGEWHDLDSSGLAYNLIRSDESYDGCKVQVELYNLIDDVDDKVDEVYKLVKYIPWLHDVELSINGDEVNDEFEYNFETSHAYYNIGADSWRNTTDVYNKGAYVKSDTITKTRSFVVSKNDLDVNFARNDILETCEEYNVIQEELKSLTFDYLAEDGDITDREARWLLKQCEGDDHNLTKIENKQIVKDVFGDRWSINQLQGETVTFAKSDNKMAEKASTDAGCTVIDQTFETDVRNLINGSNLMSLESVIDEEMKWEMREVDEHGLSKRRKRNLERARWFLSHIGSENNVKPGYSKTEKVWKDKDDTIFIDKGTLNSRKKEFIVVVLDDVMEMAAHDGSTRAGVSHNTSFYRAYWRYAKNSGEQKLELLNGNIELRL